MNNEEKTQLQDISKVANIDPDIILKISQEVSWLRETTCRRTPCMVPGITRADTDKEAIHYVDGVAATLVALREMGLIAPEGLTGYFPEEPFAEHAPKSASDFI